MTSVAKKITEKRLMWYGHVGRRDEGHMLGMIADAQVAARKTDNHVEILV